MKTISVLLATGLLAGCQTMGQARRPMSEDPTSACLRAMDGDPRFELLRSRFGGRDGPTLAMRASKEFATEADKAAISEAASTRQACVTQGREFRVHNFPPQHAELVEIHNRAALSLMAKLYAGDITYGDYIARRESLQADIATAWSGATSQVQATQAQNRQALAAENAQTLQILQMLSPPQPAFRPPITCTSRPFGNSVTTQCN